MEKIILKVRKICKLSKFGDPRKSRKLRKRVDLRETREPRKA